MPESQVKIDDAEWNNRKNWHFGPLGVYYSRKDSRAFVAKRSRRPGITINFGSPVGVGFAIVFLGLIIFMAISLPSHH